MKTTAPQQRRERRDLLIFYFAVTFIFVAAAGKAWLNYRYHSALKALPIAQQQQMDMSIAL